MNNVGIVIYEFKMKEWKNVQWVVAIYFIKIGVNLVMTPYVFLNIYHTKFK